MANTLTIVKSSDECIFGGYTDAVWDQRHNYKTDHNAFIFSLVNKDGHRALKMKISPNLEKFAINCSPDHGPMFGGGSGFEIGDKSNENFLSRSDLGNTFKHPVHPGGSQEAMCFLAGRSHFKVNEIEVFQKIV
jgi:hypothetical protein